MKNLVLLCILFFCSNLFAQKQQEIVLKSNFTSGKNFLDNSDIKAIRYKFSDEIYHFFVDVNSNYLTVQLQGNTNMWNDKTTGKIIQYDLNNSVLLWNKEENYKNLNLFTVDNSVIFSNDKQSTFVNSQTGENRFVVKNQIHFVVPQRNIAIGYNTNLYGIDYRLEGINLTNGKVLWKTDKVRRSFGWSDIYCQNDTALLIVSSGFHSIGLKDGKGHHISFETGQRNYKTGYTLGNMAMGLGVMLGHLGVFYIGENMLYNVNSNVLIDNDFIYFASMKNIVKISKNIDNIVWHKKFAKKEASQSVLFEKDSSIFMVNKGLASFDNTIIPYGKPFVAAFNKETANENFLTYTEKPIIDFDTLDNNIYLLTEQKISCFSAKNGKLIKEQVFLQKKFGNLKYFADNKIFISNNNNTFFCLKQSDATNLYLFTDNKIIILDDDLNVIETENFDNIYVYYAKIGENKLVGNSVKTFIIDKNGTKIAELWASNKAVMVENKLYEKKRTDIEIINLEKFE
ncbi:MAG: hypothetical protein LBB53_01630 [Prevotellaceae bacterium]|jgi:hypothetical protein|nr:hypothetical protein [Prevotellaceae bacterium]